jgi:hypothetical protein
MIKPPTTPQPKPPAQIIITVDWPNDYDDDIDVWVEDPLGNIVWYTRKNAGFMSLDRDDLGNSSDVVNQFNLNLNREIVLIRGIVPGEYTVNIFGYKRKDARDFTPVTVEITKLTNYQIIHISKLDIKEGEEKTVVRFVLDANGKLISKNHLFKKLTINR